MTYLQIACDSTWVTVPRHPGPGPGWATTTEDPIPLTPRAAAWIEGRHDQSVPNPLASALLGFLQLPIRQLIGPVRVTGYRDGDPQPLDAQQLTAFVSALRALRSMPDYLALHAQACRVAAAWSCPTIHGSSL